MYQTFLNNILDIISDGVALAVPRHTVMKNLKLEISLLGRKKGLSDKLTGHLYNVARNAYFRAFRAGFARMRSLTSPLEKKAYAMELIQPYRIRVTVDSVSRIAHVQRMLEYSRAKKRPYYIVTSLSNPASYKDHKEYEGKIYIDANWKSYILDENTRNKIKAYNKNHRIKSVQEIVGAPVYLFTRPNCRHRFKSVPIRTVLNNSVKKLNKMYK